MVYVPKGSYKDYFVNSGWIYFSDFREMGVLDIALSETTLRMISLLISIVRQDGILGDSLERAMDAIIESAEEYEYKDKIGRAHV